MKYVYVGFSQSKEQSFFWKVSLNLFLIGLNQLYTGHTTRSSRGKAYNKILLLSSQCVSRGVVVTKRPSDSRQYLFFFFSSFLFFVFTFSFLFSYCSLVLVSLHSLRFFYIINFLYHCLNSCDSRISSNNNNSWAWSVWVPVDVNFLHVFCQIVGFLGEILAYQEFLHGNAIS